MAASTSAAALSGIGAAVRAPRTLRSRRVAQSTVSPRAPKCPPPFFSFSHETADLIQSLELPPEGGILFQKLDTSRRRRRRRQDEDSPCPRSPPPAAPNAFVPPVPDSYARKTGALIHAQKPFWAGWRYFYRMWARQRRRRGQRRRTNLLSSPDCSSARRAAAAPPSFAPPPTLAVPAKPTSGTITAVGSATMSSTLDLEMERTPPTLPTPPPPPHPTPP
jgi:hypothetical protein